MNLKHTLLAAALTVSLSGCATAGALAGFVPQATGAATPQAQASPETEQAAHKTDKRRLFKKAGIGCAIGGLMGMLGGNTKDALKACAAGAVVGGLIDWRAQVNEAREVEAAAKAAGMQAEVRTEQATDDQGQAGEKLQQLVIAYDPADMTAMDARTVELLDKLAGLTTRAKNQLTVRFEGTTACAVPLAELTKRHALERHQVDVACGSGKHRIVISPLPDVR